MAEYPDAEAVVITLLAQATGVPAYGKLPPRFTPPGFLVTAIGGEDDGFIYSATVEVQTFGATRAERRQLTSAAVEAVHGVRNTLVGGVLADRALITVPPQDIPASDPDVRASVFTAQFEFRRPRTAF